MTVYNRDMELPKIIAIVRLPEYSAAVRVAEALEKGGVSALEFTFTGAGVPEAVEEVRRRFPELKVGVGSVRTTEQVNIASSCGAQFIVTPALNPQVNKLSKSYGLTVASGSLTPTEMLQAVESGADYVKVFPIRHLGPQYIKDVLAPLPDLRIVPTGGVDHTNARSYLDAGAVAVAVGGSLVDTQAVARGDFGVLTERAAELIRATEGNR
jgi:2-dehydro-3-deoxyphosphogluconate aldolase/(4S)-4-hydroxy-2-oxoglutarate aldolase